MNYERIINELKQAWDALDALSVAGYSTRARVQAAQEGILSVYNEAVKAKKTEEHDEAAADVTAEGEE